MIETIFFDLDWVLTTNKKWSIQTCEYISKNTSIALDTLLNAHKEFWEDLALWRRNYRDIWEDFCRLANINVNISILEEAFSSTEINQPILEIAKRLKENKYKVGIITDNPQERFDIISKKYELDKVFNPITVSSNIWYVKDNKKIFEDALEKANATAESSVFIDNSKKNLEVPSSMWFLTFFYDDTLNDFWWLVEYLNSMWIDI